MQEELLTAEALPKTPLEELRALARTLGWVRGGWRRSKGRRTGIGCESGRSECSTASPHPLALELSTPTLFSSRFHNIEGILQCLGFCDGSSKRLVLMVHTVVCRGGCVS